MFGIILLITSCIVAAIFETLFQISPLLGIGLLIWFGIAWIYLMTLAIFTIKVKKNWFDIIITAPIVACYCLFQTLNNIISK